MHPVSNTLATEWQNSSPITILFMQNIKATTLQCSITTGIVRHSCLGNVIMCKKKKKSPSRSVSLYSSYMGSITLNKHRNSSMGL